MNSVELLSSGGRIAKALPAFESRPEQIQMASAVRDAFARREHLIVEAGTGVGKSFAYLLPAIERVVDHEQCVAISTRTISLQEQLINKDIPFLRSALDVTFSAELLKGRSNYLGLRRLTHASARQERLFGSRAEFESLWHIEDWALQTRDGSLSDLDRQPLPAVWDRVKSENDNCMGRRCPTYGKCFYQRARRRAEQAGIVIINHALFFSDLAVRRQGGKLLPDFDLVVFDEAHWIDSIAADHFGCTVSNLKIRALLNALHNPRTKRGLLFGKRHQEALDAVRAARETAEAYFERIEAWRRSSARSSGRLREPPDVPNHAGPALRELARRLVDLRKEAKTDDERFALGSFAERSNHLADQLDFMTAQPEDAWVYWIDSAPARRRVSLCAKPIETGDLLNEWLFSTDKTVVLTSATLADGDDHAFEYMRGRLGLTGGRSLRLGSPFDFANQMNVIVEDQLPEPASDQFADAACQAVARHVTRHGGRSLVLFTSYDMLRQFAQILEPPFARDGISLLVQGADMDRSALLDALRTQPRTAVLGTDSFWEGVDVPGSALGCVIIVRLPFVSPGRPDVEARIERLRSQQRNPFTEYQLPEAVLKFKQGIGRLIRTRQDRGDVVILDRRILSKPYGRRFLAALPACTIKTAAGDTRIADRAC